MSTQVSTPAQLDSLVQKATSESIPNGEIDLPLSLEISDVIRSRRIPPKECMRCLKKRVLATRSNPNTQLASWKLIEVCIKNGGIPFIKEICSREFMDCLEHAIVQDDTNEELEKLCTQMLHELYIAFKNDSQLNYVSKVYQKLAARGVEFPSMPDSDLTAAMFDSKTPADWIDSDACMICSCKFTLLNRKHHCRSCGGIFCQEHSSRSIPLPDLGILEPVRVCDNCYDDYDLKRQTGKKQRKKKNRRSTRTEEGDDDDDLRRAIELSLRESKHSDTVVPIVKQHGEPVQLEEEEDPDLKAAIEASLREAEEERRRKERMAAQNTPYPSYQMPQISQPEQPSYQLTTSEEEDIQLFASLVERMKTQPITAVLEDTQLQQLYRKVISSRPKLNNALNETVNKYNTLIDMNAKISDIMNIYDALLEKQLRNINLSHQYTVPQVPSDPYAYYRVEEAQLKPQPQPQPQSQPQQQNQQHSIQNPMEQQQQQQQQHRYNIQSPVAQQIQVPAPVNHAAQLHDLVVQPTVSRQKHQIPSEPPYPIDDEEQKQEELIYKETTTQSKESKEANNITNYDFPTVPVRKLPANEEQESELVDGEQEDNLQPSEQLLIEL